MPNSAQSAVETSVDKMNMMLKEIEQEYGWPKERRNQSYGALRAVLHALRDRMPIEETAQLGAQLPMIVRGIFYEGWDPTVVPVKMGREEFLERVRLDFPWEVPGGIAHLVQTTLNAVRRYTTEGQWQDVKTGMPKELASIIP
jgi:uncharacterized protein (DUF2267 family)